MREVIGSNPGQGKPKTYKLIVVATLPGRNASAFRTASGSDMLRPEVRPFTTMGRFVPLAFLHKGWGTGSRQELVMNG